MFALALTSLILPEEAAFDLIPMSDEEAAERELQSRRIFQSRGTLSADTEWTSATNTVFDGLGHGIDGRSLTAGANAVAKALGSGRPES